ncbi:MAG: signal recognition particle protein [Candidatus Delongbacteria bacterium]|jgi:signal recognition particle subunit SRP54|nr:signal recognition particle protein [Candidatus Delongbacteria bacterium]MDY0017202.1 signal recognition particle protein [Candidatus Delongbacteria bacterium]
MFEDLSGKLESIFKTLKGQHRISEENIKASLREVRVALLEADVNYVVVKDFINRVRDRAIGEKVFEKLTPGQLIIKFIHEELVRVLGGGTAEVIMQKGAATVIMMCGLQGSGKTTHTAKLASYFRKKNKSRPLMVAADIYRPAAIDQLKTLGKQLNIPVYSEDSKDVAAICVNALEFAKENRNDLIILDTAGRLHIDEAMMNELIRVKERVQPHEILFVADSMIGQDAVTTAAEFNEKLNFDGVILTKMDGDSRGGAALSIREVTGKPIKFVGTGEKLDEIEAFHPDRLAQRILGMGDILSLVEKAQDSMDQSEAERLARKIEKEDFTYEDFLAQIRQIKKMGSIKSMLKMMPGIGNKLDAMDIDEKAFVKIEAIIHSMTKKERNKPQLLNGSRKLRIARGSGRSVQEINQLIKQFEQMNMMMRQIRKIGFNKLARGMFGAKAPARPY